MRYRVGRKQKVAILNQDGHQVALCRYPHSPENMAQKICDLLNKDEHEQAEAQEREKANLNIKRVSNSVNYKEKYDKCINIIKRFDAGIIGMYDL